jgi:kynurenine formamidase
MKKGKFVDLSHNFEDKMPGFRMKRKDGTLTQYTTKIYPFLTHNQTKPFFHGKCSFEITEITFQTSVGTYIDSPYHRYPKGRDISEIKLEEVILPGLIIDIRGKNSFESVGLEIIPKNTSFKGKAVLFNFGWDKYWGKEQYYSYPYISEDLIEFLIKQEVKLIGVDTINIDNSNNMKRPAHTLFLKNEIFIVENLTNLNRLYGMKFRFFGVPIKGKKVTSMPIRAFAEIL